MFPVGAEPMYGKSCRGSRMYITKSGSKIYFDIKAERKDNYILLKSEKNPPSFPSIFFQNGFSMTMAENTQL